MNAEWWINLQQLDADQKRVMALPLNGNHLVLGPPGSGKTNLLLLRASYLLRAGVPNVLVVVFGRTLKEFLVRGSNQYRFDQAKITTSTKWLYDILRQLGEPVPASLDRFEDIRAALIERVRAAIAKNGQRPLYDAVLLDEAQDFLPEEIEIFSRLAGQMFAVGDGNQKIYSGDTALSHLTRHCELHQLTHHYRNGLRICRFADSIAAPFPDYKPLVGTSNYSESKMRSSVEMFRCADLDQQAAQIATAIQLQLKAYPNELLGVLCPRRTDVNSVYDALLRTNLSPHLIKQSFEDGYVAFNDNQSVCVTTIHGSKGLEFRALHAPLLEHVRSFPRQRNLLFTLATRAKTSLSLYCSGPVPGFVETAMMALTPPVELPPLEAAFGETF